MNKILIFLWLFVVVSLLSYGQSDDSLFIEQLISNNTNNTEFFKSIIKQTEFVMDNEDYKFIPVFDLVFRKLNRNEKKVFAKHENLQILYSCGLRNDSAEYKNIDSLIKSKYLTFLNTEKIFLSNIYIFKDSVYCGIIRENVYNGKFFFQKPLLYDISNFEEKLVKFILQESSVLLFTIRRPYSPLFAICDNKIKVIEYDSINKFLNIVDFDDYIKSNNFILGINSIDNKRYVTK